MANISNNHRYFIQYMLKNGITTLDNALNYCSNISNGEVQEILTLKTIVIEINREISKQSYKLVFSTCEVTNQNMLVWLNTKNDENSRLQKKYSALELEYFHTLLQEILHNEEHRIAYFTCINITSTLSSFLSRENGQKMLKTLINTGYFVNRGPNIYLGPRLILEFTSYLKTHFPASVCCLCSELVFWGRVCSSCHNTLHSYCLKKFLENQSNCPSCQATWTSSTEDEYEEPIDMDIDNDESTLTSQVNSTSIAERSKNKSGRTREILTDEDEEEDPNEPGPSTRRKRQR